MERESPLIIDPGRENPEHHLGFNREIPYGKSRKGELTIVRIGLDRELLNKHRFQLLQKISLLAKFANQGDEECIALLAEAVQPKSEYSLMIKEFLNLSERI